MQHNHTKGNIFFVFVQIKVTIYLKDQKNISKHTAGFFNLYKPKNTSHKV